MKLKYIGQYTQPVTVGYATQRDLRGSYDLDMGAIETQDALMQRMIEFVGMMTQQLHDNGALTDANVLALLRNVYVEAG